MEVFRERRVLFVSDFYQEEILVGVADHAHEAGWELISNMRFHGLLPTDTEADGILATAHSERVREWLKRWEGKCPIVHMGAPSESLPYPAVQADYPAAAAAGARHLLELGHVHFAFYWLADLPGLPLMVEAFEKTLAAAGRPLHRIDFPAAHPGNPVAVPREERLAWLGRALQALPRPLAVMSDDDRRSLELVTACARAGLRVPDEVAILGCENRAVETRISRTPLSSVDLNWQRVGLEAARLLQRLMEGASPPPGPLVAPPRGVIGRQSTATVVTPSPGISRALLHVREHFVQPLRLGTLAALAGMNERQFRAEFKRLVGHSPRTEIQRVRLACATCLLRDTRLKLEAVAAESGFNTAKKLISAFHTTHGQTPAAWRQQFSDR